MRTHVQAIVLLTIAQAACTPTDEGKDMKPPDLIGQVDQAPVPDSTAAPDLTPTITFYNTIQPDLVGLSCAAVGCHSLTSTTRLKIDTAPGSEPKNYGAILAQGLVNPGHPSTSPLVTVPANGFSPTGPHVRTLSGTRLAAWETWVRTGAVLGGP